MKPPIFYIDQNIIDDTLVLNDSTSKHIVQVLRMQNGEKINLTDGMGHLFICEIIDDHRKKCGVKIIQTCKIPYPKSNICIAISPIKNNTRFEWFLEKATEIGVTQIIPLICERTEKIAFKIERMKSIAVSAMLQSQQCWLPVLQEPVNFASLIKQSNQQQKFIAHCENENNKLPLTNKLINELTNPKDAVHKLMLIGPEGDFTAAEIELALQYEFIAVSLGETRLRTETAGIVAATLLLFDFKTEKIIK